jgi:protocatechuate 3,4-dioxygenase beta subunit
MSLQGASHYIFYLSAVSLIAMKITRRSFLAFLAALPFISWLPGASCKGKDSNLAVTPDCDDHPTPIQTEGPYFTPNSPERTSLREAGMKGVSLLLTGQVITTNCEPVSRALLDWWQADDGGSYDNDGYRLRGHQYTDDKGNFNLNTIVPGLYSGRTRHIHVKVQAPDKPIITTQLYFPHEAENNYDRLFNPVLLMKLSESTDVVKANYTFVVKA